MKKATLFWMIIWLNCMAVGQTRVTMYTNMGDIELEMYDSLTPITSGNFINLAQNKYYDGVIFHRVIDGFMIQGGDHTGTGSGGPGYTIQDEFDSSLSNVQKTISMANRGPNTGSSQFFINLVNNVRLDFDKPPSQSKHPVFGIVVSGFDVVQDIGKVITDTNDRPISPVWMDSVRVTFDPKTVGVGESQQESQLRIFPNPYSGQEVMTIYSQNAQDGRLELFDLQGRKVYGESIRLTQGYNPHVLSEEVRNLPTGWYSLRWEGSGKKEVFPLIITTD